MEELYFGTGGLVRAYSDSLQKAIEQAKKIKKCMGEEIEIEIEYADFEKIKYYCEKNQINIKNEKYTENIVCNLEISEGQIDRILEDLKSKGINIKKYKKLSKKFITKTY